MKILLLGEYSGLHRNLKEGLIELGHSPVVASAGDGWKNVPRDIDLRSSGSGLSGKIKSLAKPFQSLKKLKGFEVVQLINPFIFYNRFIPNRRFYSEVVEGNDSFFLLAAGDDAYYWRVARAKLKYGPFNDFLEFDIKAKNFFMSSDHAFKFNEYIANKAKGIIPIMYDYQIGYEGRKNLRPAIPIPINLSLVNFRPNIVKNKLVVFHGLNRYGFKGTKYVESAFEYLGKKYPNDLELIIKGHMPLAEYLTLMERANVVIDQTSSYSLGISGIYALAMGKVVMGGAERESLDCFKIQKSPVINIIPDSYDLIQKIEALLERRSDIEFLGEESRKYCEDHHSHLKVAQKYVEQWRAKDLIGFDKC
ncbi:glycosyltransferase [Limnohabitans curvus]|uniref:Glycosyltransferase n=1 Tax=Limnohabitans curvus TaxID=323423 RepID=A0A315ES58_9BURK|nr:glycosyltransferase [Limnohabitans curvus]PUE59625.1 glycosyltransferase [Limnohabitans curvus]